MTQIEKFKRWSEKQGWFFVGCFEGDCIFILPSGKKVVFEIDSEGNIM